MTIRPGASWGAEVPAPGSSIVATSDAEFVRLIAAGNETPVRLVGGDLARTIGVGTAAGARDTVLELPIDLVDVSSNIGEFTACAHLVARPPWWRGGWWAGPIVAVMNAQFIGRWDVAPRGHPNDGRAEVLEGDAGLSVRERLAIRNRLTLGTHVPHPRIRTRSVRQAAFQFEAPMALWVDGRSVGRVRSMTVLVRPDAAVAYA